MHRTQIYFEEELLAELKQAAQQTCRCQPISEKY
ncbi:MAG: hypothetical protein ACI9T7_000479 [Oleiphilaceae bacterium]|jgi:hypothetical protein